MASSPIKADLPGKDLYPEDCYIQTFTLGDAESLSIIQKTADTKQLYELINKRINLSVSSLTLQDLWFILHWQRINSYPSYPINLPWQCPNCEHENHDQLSGSALVIDDLNPQYKHGLEVLLSNGEKLKLRLPLVGDEEVAKKYLKDIKISNPDPKFFKEILLSCMLEPNGTSIDERVKKVQGLSADDQFLIRGFEQYFEYGVKDFAKFTCEGCGEVSKVRFSFDLTTFFPRVSHTPNIRSRILFCETPESTDRESERNGSRESDLHKGTTHTALEGSKAETRSNESQNVNEVKIANLDDIIQDR